MDANEHGWIAGERPEDGQIRRVGEDRYEFRIVGASPGRSRRSGRR